MNRSHPLHQTCPQNCSFICSDTLGDWTCALWSFAQKKEFVPDTTLLLRMSAVPVLPESTSLRLFWDFCKTFLTCWSSVRVQVRVQVWAPAGHLAITPKGYSKRESKVLTQKSMGPRSGTAWAGPTGENKHSAFPSRLQSLLASTGSLEENVLPHWRYRLGSTVTKVLILCCSSLLDSGPGPSSRLDSGPGWRRPGPSAPCAREGRVVGASSYEVMLRSALWFSICLYLTASGILDDTLPTKYFVLYNIYAKSLFAISYVVNWVVYNINWLL